GAGVDVDGVDEDEGRSLRFAAAVAESADQLFGVVDPLDLTTFLVEDGTRGQVPDDLGDPGRLTGIGKAVVGGLLFVLGVLVFLLTLFPGARIGAGIRRLLAVTGKEVRVEVEVEVEVAPLAA